LITAWWGAVWIHCSSHSGNEGSSATGVRIGPATAIPTTDGLSATKHMGVHRSLVRYHTSPRASSSDIHGQPRPLLRERNLPQNISRPPASRTHLAPPSAPPRVHPGYSRVGRTAGVQRRHDTVPAGTRIATVSTVPRCRHTATSVDPRLGPLGSFRSPRLRADCGVQKPPTNGVQAQFL